MSELASALFGALVGAIIGSTLSAWLGPRVQREIRKGERSELATIEALSILQRSVYLLLRRFGATLMLVEDSDRSDILLENWLNDVGTKANDELKEALRELYVCRLRVDDPPVREAIWRTVMSGKVLASGTWELVHSVHERRQALLEYLPPFEQASSDLEKLLLRNLGLPTSVGSL